MSIQDYKKAGVDRYQFVATLDDITCDVCGYLDGKVFPVADAKPGINFPPTHKNCRCTTVAYFEGFQPKTRFARDPITHKGMKIPYMTFSEYKEFAAFVKQQGK